MKKSIALGFVTILILVEFSMFHDFFYPFRFLWDQGKILEVSLSIILFIWSLLGSFLIFFSGRSLLRKITLPFFLFFYLFNIGSYDISNAPMDFHQALTIVRNFQWWLGAVVENFGLNSLPLIIILIPVIILVERLPKLLQINFSKKLYVIPISAVMFTTIGLNYTNGFFDRYPSFFRIPSMFIFANQSSIYNGKREEAVYSGAFDTQIEKIVMIVDESIRADILGVNGYKKETTPFLDSLKTGIVNFGLAASASNCSDYSNLILRTGVKKEEIPDINQMTLKKPSIWQFAKKAGFYNVYIDAQSAEEWKNYQNLMNDHEASFIDKIIRVRQKITYESDGVAREKLKYYLRQPGKTFIVQNKYGMHFPYSRSYAEKDTLFRPTLEHGELMSNREKSLNSYMNGIRWSVDTWFEGLLSKSSDHFKNYVIIYTGDHGQNIVDDGTLATHCRPAANRFEGIVPMMMFSNSEVILEKFKLMQTTNYDQTSHFQVFPTLMELLGYKEAWVLTHYGSSLSKLSDTLPEFFVGDIYGRGSVRKWIPIL
ncbi:MAG: sulfatase-like hydrolase/transferase, partial [Sulfurovum sp.]|nr:sulfatase-like hydrolase/transferase [Sulfurovum sp.]